MLHLAAFFGNVTNGANAQVNALSDQILTIQNNDFLLPQDMAIRAVEVLGSTVNTARLTSPTLRQITNPQIRPITQAALPATNANMQFYRGNPLHVKGGEELQLQATGNSSVSTGVTGLIWLQDTVMPVSAADIITITGTSTGTATANQWTGISYTLSDQLPTGTYAMVGSEVISTNGQAHRWTIDNLFWRPGALSVTSLANRQHDWLYQQFFGEWGRFRNTSLPRLEVLCNSGDTSHTIFLQIQRVGP